MTPNAPRMLTVVVAVVLLVIGAILALPIAQGANLLEPLAKALAPLGVHFDRQLGYILLLVGDLLLIVGSLVRGL
ncbi:MAG: hypothetical protein M3067_05520 [Chloroflexota bacterium]|nr:hypothetical protein [Chloroflexota bacterium]